MTDDRERPLMPPPPRDQAPDVRKFPDGAKVLITAGPLQGQHGEVVRQNNDGKPKAWLLLVRLSDGREVWCNDGYLVDGRW